MLGSSGAGITFGGVGIGIEKPAVVIDFGSAYVRCGYAGESHPRHIVPSVVAGSPERVGLCRTREAWLVPLTEFFVCMFRRLLICRPRERRVLLCEPIVCPAALREAMAVVLLRYLQVQSLCLVPGAFPALYCTGVMSGVVLDVGHAEASAVAVYDGVPLLHTYAAAPLGARAVRARLVKLLGEAAGGSSNAQARWDEQGAATAAATTAAAGAPLPTESAAAAAAAVAAETAAVAPSLTDEDLEDVVARACIVPVRGAPAAADVSTMDFLLRGGRRVTVPGAVRAAAAADALFGGDDEGCTLATLLLDCLDRCPRDARAATVGNVLVVGGGAMLPGLCARLGEELRATATTATAGEPSELEMSAPGTKKATESATADTPAAALMATTASATAANEVPPLGAAAAVLHGACVSRTPFARSLLTWSGASLMAALGGLAERSLSRDSFLAAGGERVPDWLSLAPQNSAAFLGSKAWSAAAISAGVATGGAATAVR